MVIPRTARRRRPFAVALSALRQRLQGQPPKILFHYTSADGIKGILQSASLWASNVAHLNDTRELGHGADVVHSVVSDEISSANEPRWRGLLEMTRDALNLRQRYDGGIYAVSFCSEGDLLSQWRGYASMGGGYCIGFVPGRFQATDPAAPCTLRRVFYTKRDQRNVIKEVLKLARTHMPQGRRRTESLLRELKEASTALATELFSYFSSFKDPSFAEEHEWRLVYVFDPKLLTEKLEFRAATTGLKPYVPVAVAKGSRRLPIKVIRHGPALNPQLARHSVQLLLERAKYDVERIELAASVVPYRP